MNDGSTKLYVYWVGNNYWKFSLHESHVQLSRIYKIKYKFILGYQFKRTETFETLLFLSKINVNITKN